MLNLNAVYMYGESLDERLAREHFLGKTRAEAKALIKSNFLYYAEDLAWMPSDLFSVYIHSVIDLAEEEFAEFHEESADTLCCIVSMLESRHILNGNKKDEPLEAIGELLCKSKEFCKRSMQNPIFQHLHKRQQRSIISPLNKLVSLEKKYLS